MIPKEPDAKPFFSLSRWKSRAKQQSSIPSSTSKIDEEPSEASADRVFLDLDLLLKNSGDHSITISNKMSIQEVLGHLGARGCNDITALLDSSESSQYPVSTGGFGDVYRGALKNGSLVSVKCLRLLDLGSSEERRKDLKHAARELYVWSKCRHENILELSGVALYRNQLAMVSPWMENGNVGQFLSKNPHYDRYRICTQIAVGVGYLHGEKIAHGDLKGANILISDDFSAKIADFGNSILTLSNHTLKFTETTSGPGLSPRWTPPEILEERTRFTLAGDIYSLAMTLLEIITGSVPYTGNGDWAAMSKVVKGVPPDRLPEHFPLNDPKANFLWSLFTDCWAYEPQNRPTATRVVEAIRGIRSPA